MGDVRALEDKVWAGGWGLEGCEGPSTVSGPKRPKVRADCLGPQANLDRRKARPPRPSSSRSFLVPPVPSPRSNPRSQEPSVSPHPFRRPSECRARRRPGAADGPPMCKGPLSLCGTPSNSSQSPRKGPRMFKGEVGARPSVQCRAEGGTFVAATRKGVRPRLWTNRGAARSRDEIGRDPVSSFEWVTRGWGRVCREFQQA